jgi:bifunctional DNA-binding transcriptional regulator/antitoxin component of YhaV-PrlF toxin-antitoxin module
MGKNEGEAMSGRVSPEKREAEFPATIDSYGKVHVPDYVREMLKIRGKKVRVQVWIQVREVF